MSSNNANYLAYISQMQKIADVKYAAAVLQWDQETYLPPKGANARSRQLATLSELAHELSVDASLGKLLLELKDDSTLSFIQQRNIATTLEEYQKQQKFSSAFVRRMSEAVSGAFYAWLDARKENNFATYIPALEKLVALKREEANLLGYQSHPYNALLNEYEKGSTVAQLDEVFEKVLGPLSELLSVISKQPKPDNTFLHLHYPQKQQWEWGMYLVKELGYDLEAGRQDISEHPFTINFSAKDVRITTRIDEHDLANLTWSCIHETGHALYEQGLPDEAYGLPSGEYASLSIHESQSRLWENCVGRNIPFWEYYLPKLREFFPVQLEGISAKQFVTAINRVEPSLIRTEADELTYHFHVYIRYLLEKQLIAGEIQVKDIPVYWNELYAKYLGVTVPDDKRGCLQDVHWSHGSFGYFPTYSLGSFYAAQFWQKCKEVIPAVEQDIAQGNTAGLLAWLRNNIHWHGKTYTSKELCEKVTGKPLDSNLFVEYLRSKLLS